MVFRLAFVTLLLPTIAFAQQTARAAVPVQVTVVASVALPTVSAAVAAKAPVVHADASRAPIAQPGAVIEVAVAPDQKATLVVTVIVP